MLNRGVGKMRLFAKERDFEAFEEVIGQAKERLPMRVLAWRVMSASGIVRTATVPAWWTPARCRYPGAGVSTCKLRKPRRNWQRYGAAWYVVRLSATPIGNSIPRSS